ncbi:MAG TPA: tripartite tricarboxylate transporter substrate-binding protein, partial [Ramlibacter sp.]
PQAVVDKLNAEVRKIVAQPDTKAAWTKQGATPMSMNPAQFAEYLNKDIAKWGAIVKASGIKPE